MPCAQACPTTEQLKLRTFFNLMLLKQKAAVAWSQKGAEETLGSDAYFHYFDCGDGLSVYTYIIKICTSIKLLSIIPP